MIKEQVTKAILLVGGRGTRLQPLTNLVPKPMLRIAGKPVTEHQIVKARESGITEIVLATSYLAEVFQPYFGDGSVFDVKIHYAIEKEPLGTGGAIAHAAQKLRLDESESVFIFNGDVLSGHDLKSQAKLHHQKGAAVTLHLTTVEDARAYGCVPLDDDGQVHEFLEKMDKPKANTINAGCYLFTAATINEIPRDTVVSVERETFPTLLQRHVPIYGFEDSKYWIDMGTPEAMIRASRDLILSRDLSNATPEVQGEALLEEDVTVNPTSKVGGGSFLARGSSVGAECEISGTIVGEEAVIEDHVILKNSYIAPFSRVKSGSRIEGQVFGF